MRQFCAYIQYHRWLLLGFCLLLPTVYCSRQIFTAPNPPGQISYIDQLGHIEQQLARAETQINEKEESLGHLYSAVLYTRGRFTCKTIVAGNPSRLSLGGSSLKTSRAARESRSMGDGAYVRYSDASFDITMPSAVTAYELDTAFHGTPLYGLGKDFITAELATNINAIFLAALAIHESSWGNSILAKENNNLFGFGAYDSDPGMAKSFASKGESIAYVATFLRNHYIDGTYYRGHSIRDINTLYSSDPNWAKGIFFTMTKIDSAIQRSFSS